MKKLHKKGQGVSKTPFLIISIFVITIAIFAFIYISSTIMGSFFYTPKELRESLYSNRILLSPDCFVYQDPFTGRVYPGVFDEEKLNQEQIDSCFDAENSKYQFYITIYKESENNGMSAYKIIQTSFFGEPVFDMGRHDRGTYEYPVLILMKDTKKIEKGVIYIIMQKI